MDYENIVKFISGLVFRLYHYMILPLRYKMTVKGLDQLKGKPGRGFLFLSNHPTHLDASLIGTALAKEGHQISIWSMDFVYKNAYAKMCARQTDTLRMLKVPNVHERRGPKHRTQVRRLIRRTVEGLQKGENVLFFPAGYQKFTPREEINGKSAVQRILAQDPDVQIVMVRITGMWGSRFSKAASKSERSNVRGHWGEFVWKIVKIFLLNFIFFIPRRKVTVDFVSVGPDFPRQGTRKEINQYLEDFFNRGYGEGGEPLQRVPDYFWKPHYVAHAYHLKNYEFNLDLVPEQVKQDVIHGLAKRISMPGQDFHPKLLLDRDLSLDSLEMTDLFIELESKYPAMPRLTPNQVTSIGHLMALTAGAPIEYKPIQGQFSLVQQEVPSLVKAWQVCAGFMASALSFIDLHNR